VRIVGIDPGTSGAIALIAPGAVIVDDLPVIGNRINGAEFARILSVLKADVIVVENVNAMPGQGVSSVWTFAHSVGVVHGVVAALGIRMELVTPAKWKAHFNLGRDKEASRMKCIQKYPAVTGLGLKKHSDRAEALLIATYYQETNRDRTAA